MTERSLSALYQAEVRRGDAVASVDDLLALHDSSGTPDPDALDRLIATPDALAIHGIARSASDWSTLVAEDVRRARSAPSVGRARHVGWISLAAAASLAVCVVGLRQRGNDDSPLQSADVTSPQSTSADVLFTDPDSSMIAAAAPATKDSIFTDSLDAATSPLES